MHTDEYEISIGREVALCRRLIKRLEQALRDREERYAMTTEDLLLALEERRVAGERPEFREWREDHLELQYRRRQLSEYLVALKGLQTS